MSSLTFLMDLGTTLGLLGIIPQMYRTVRNRDVLKDISLTSQLVFSAAISCFTVFAAVNDIWITMAMDIFQLGYSGLTIALIIRANKIKKQGIRLRK